MWPACPSRLRFKGPDRATQVVLVGVIGGHVMSLRAADRDVGCSKGVLKLHSPVTSVVNPPSAPSKMRLPRTDIESWLLSGVKFPIRGYALCMDAITLLKSDHKAVEQLFRRFEKAGERATASKRQIVDRIVRELSIHAAIEEQAFYPVLREVLPEVEDEIFEGLEEHHVVKWTLSELDGMDPQAERFDAKVTVLMESVRRHVHKKRKGNFFQRFAELLVASNSKRWGRRWRRPKGGALAASPSGSGQPAGQRGCRERGWSC